MKKIFLSLVLLSCTTIAFTQGVTDIAVSLVTEHTGLSVLVRGVSSQERAVLDAANAKRKSVSKSFGAINATMEVYDNTDLIQIFNNEYIQSYPGFYVSEPKLQFQFDWCLFKKTQCISWLKESSALNESESRYDMIYRVERKEIHMPTMFWMKLLSSFIFMFTFILFVFLIRIIKNSI